MLRDDMADRAETYHRQYTTNRVMIERIRNNEEVDIQFLKQQFIEMYDLIKKNNECPVCMEVMTKDNLDVPYCGHLICKGCKETIKGQNNLCPTCRKKF
jgi:predicted RecB family nuclease